MKIAAIVYVIAYTTFLASVRREPRRLPAWALIVALTAGMVMALWAL